MQSKASQEAPRKAQKIAASFFVYGLLGVAALGCGSGKSSDAARRSSQATPTAGVHTSALVRGGYSRHDGDHDDDDAPGYKGTPTNDDSALLASYGRSASRADARAAASIVKRYFAASLAGDGAAACSLLAQSVAEGLAASGSRGGGSCAAAMSAFLSGQHQRLVEEDLATMAVTSVRTNGTLALAVLNFKAAPESEIVLEREAGGWKLDALFAGEMT